MTRADGHEPPIDSWCGRRDVAWSSRAKRKHIKSSNTVPKTEFVCLCVCVLGEYLNKNIMFTVFYFMFDHCLVLMVLSVQFVVGCVGPSFSFTCWSTSPDLPGVVDRPIYLQPARKRRSSLLWKLWDAPAPSLQDGRRCTCPTSLASPSTPRRTWKCTELLAADRKFSSYQLYNVSELDNKILQINTACALVHLLCLVARTRSPKRFACLYFLGKRSILLVAPVRIWRSLNHDYGRLFFGIACDSVLFLWSAALAAKVSVHLRVWFLLFSGLLSRLPHEAQSIDPREEYHDHKASGRLVPDGTNVRRASGCSSSWIWSESSGNSVHCGWSPSPCFSMFQ